MFNIAGSPASLRRAQLVEAGLMVGQIMFIVYFLKSIIAKKSYVGFTNNIEQRLKEHNLGRHYYTKRFAPWEIIYTEKFNNFQEAVKREKYLKSTSGRRFLKKIFNNCGIV